MRKRGWQSDLARVAVEAPDKEVRLKAAELLLCPVWIYQEGMVDPRDFEEMGVPSIPVIGPPTEVVARAAQTQPPKRKWWQFS